MRTFTFVVMGLECISLRSVSCLVPCHSFGDYFTHVNVTDELSRLFTGAVAASGEVTTTEGVEEPESSGGDLTPNTPHGTAQTQDGQSNMPIASDPEDSTHPATNTASEQLVGSDIVDGSASRSPQPSRFSPLAAALQVHVLPSTRPPHPLFKTEQLRVDRRLIVNRKRQLKMYRVWMQGQFRKPLNSN